MLQLLVLKYVQNKDVFMRYHKAHLTRRLILDTSADNEKEENMVEWLRVSVAFLSGGEGSVDTQSRKLSDSILDGRWCEYFHEEICEEFARASARATMIAQPPILSCLYNTGSKLMLIRCRGNAVCWVSDFNGRCKRESGQCYGGKYIHQ